MSTPLLTAQGARDSLAPAREGSEAQKNMLVFRHVELSFFGGEK
jgi:hypothetical protein